MTTVKTTEFMIQLADQLKTERKLAETSVNQYIQTLYKLNGSKPFKNLAWTKKYEDVQNVIDTYAKSTQGNQYMVLTSALSLFNDKATYKAPYNHWRDKMMDARKERDAQEAGVKTEKQEENWLTWEEVSKKKSGLKEDISPFLSNKVLSSTQFDKLVQYVIISLYTDIAPRRNQDYLDMYVVKKLGKDYDTNKNYYDLATQRFVFNKYKTAKKTGEQSVDVPAPLQEVLADYIKHHPLAKGKVKEYKLLVKQDGSALNTVNSITRILNRIFGQKIGSSALRHFYHSSKFGGAIKDLKEAATNMGHSMETAIKDYIKH
jgi:hypothetical protein